MNFSPSDPPAEPFWRTTKLFLLLAFAGVCVGNAALSASRDGMKIIHQVILSPTHQAAPYLIVKASNSDLIIAGAAGLGNNRAWATRVSESGELIWEYVNGPAGGWTDFSDNHQRFYGVIDLINGNTLLCGTKKIEGKIVAFLVRLTPDGKLIDERILETGTDGFPVGEIQCLRTTDGVAVLSWIAVLPSGIGSLLKLDPAGNILWQKLGAQFHRTDAMPAEDGGLFIIGAQYVIKVDREGNELVRALLPMGSGRLFIHPVGKPARVNISASPSTLKTTITEFDLNLHGPVRETHLTNLVIKRGLESQDGIVTLFGSRHYQSATAGAGRAYPGGDSRIFALEPHFQSIWFYDAAQVDEHGHLFATVRSLAPNGTAALAWISFDQ